MHIKVVMAMLDSDAAGRTVSRHAAILCVDREKTNATVPKTAATRVTVWPAAKTSAVTVVVCVNFLTLA